MMSTFTLWIHANPTPIAPVATAQIAQRNAHVTTKANRAKMGTKKSPEFPDRRKRGVGRDTPGAGGRGLVFFFIKM